MMQIIGILDSASPESRGEELTAFHSALKEAGIDGRNAMILYGWANNDYSRLPAIARELVDNEVAVIVAAGGPVSALAAKAATDKSKTPVVFTTVTDPVKSGLVDSLKRPGGHLTGTYGYTSELEADRLKVLDALTTKPGAIGVLVNPQRPHPKNPDLAGQKGNLETAAKKIGRSAVVLGAGTEGEINAGFKELKTRVENGEVVALLVTADPFFNSRRAQVIALANELAIPAIYQWPGFVEAGGLMSYGPSKTEAYHNAGDYVGCILKGQQPGELPVRETNKFELVIEPTMARTLGIEIPKQILGNPVRVI